MDELAAVSLPGLDRRAGRTAAVSALFRVHHRRLVGLAALLVDDSGSAEEVVQEAFVALCAHWRMLRDPNAAVAYLNRCVVNGSRDRLRRKGRYAAVVTHLVPRSEELESAERTAVAHDESDRLWREITDLPRRQREVLVLRYYLDHSEAEIADTLGVSPGSVKTHGSRGLATLARRLDIEP